MPKTKKVELSPRKTPVQERSSVSVQAIREATIQVLLAVGKEKLTTTRVAERAGVSVGTLYQYFPNKSALLQAVLRAHLDNVYREVTAASEAAHGKPLAEMAGVLVTSFLDAKFRHEQASRAMYFVSDDVGGVAIAREYSAHAVKVVAAMLQSSPERLRGEAQMIATTVMVAMAGVSRRMIESGHGSRKTMQALRHELDTLVRAYLQARVA